MANERIWGKHRCSACTTKFFFSLIVTCAGCDDELRVQNFRRERHVDVFRITADGGDETARCFDSCLLQNFVLGGVADKRDHSLVSRPSGAFDFVIDKYNGRLTPK